MEKETKIIVGEDANNPSLPEKRFGWGDKTRLHTIHSKRRPVIRLQLAVLEISLRLLKGWHVGIQDHTAGRGQRRADLASWYGRLRLGGMTGRRRNRLLPAIDLSFLGGRTISRRLRGERQRAGNLLLARCRRRGTCGARSIGRGLVEGGRGPTSADTGHRAFWRLNDTGPLLGRTCRFERLLRRIRCARSRRLEVGLNVLFGVVGPATTHSIA